VFPDPGGLLTDRGREIHHSSRERAYRHHMEFIFVLIYIAIIALVIASYWKVFQKAGRPGWESIIPIYNLWILNKEIAKGEVLHFVLCIIPCVNIVGLVLVNLKVAERFGKSQGFGIGMALLPFVFYPMLAFGEDQYQG
jgi:hypothetical protein